VCAGAYNTGLFSIDGGGGGGGSGDDDDDDATTAAAAAAVAATAATAAAATTRRWRHQRWPQQVNGGVRRPHTVRRDTVVEGERNHADAASGAYHVALEAPERVDRTCRIEDASERSDFWRKERGGKKPRVRGGRERVPRGKEKESARGRKGATRGLALKVV